ncbi:hypothetical protein WN51_07398 [Melipona quadrifasciata]|uniref:PiggyBac transposable element-derived protein domain-containing protein n=1 Tax=Melipona quadrifasciata TaxID=166423 RepID=A0A0M8ZPX8_9HYME|nr:hypothetical protein WN51_07398 [Melipona quadrifasciata]
MLHFSDNNIANDDPLIKIRSVVDKLRISFSQSFSPYENLCIDESLLTDINKNNAALGISGNVVMTLLQLHLGKSHTLISDN